ncbi:MAG: TolC family protein [Candidatus Ancaeobacter aquaticus]|nr:TolC family protein [Candidatus Ancaeobacter aquaticus]
MKKTVCYIFIVLSVTIVIQSCVWGAEKYSIGKTDTILIKSDVHFPDAPRISHEGPLTINDALKIALQHNPNINKMIHAVQQSVYIHSASTKERLPVVSTDYNFTWFQKGLDGDFDGVTTPIAYTTSFMWGAHVKMPIYTGGALAYKESIAKFGIDVTRMRFYEAKADLIQEVIINYFNVLKLQNYVKVVAENVERFTQHEDMTRKYFKVGVVGKNNLLEVQAKRANVQQDLIVAEKDLVLANAALKVSMGINIDSKFELEDITTYKEPDFSIDEYYEEAKTHNPSLVAFTFLKKRAEKAMELAKTPTRPKVNAGLSYYRHGRTVALKGDDFFTNNILMGTVIFKWDIFDWFKARDHVMANKEEIEQLIENQKIIGQKIFLDIRQAHLNMLAAKNKFSVAEKGIEYAEENYRITSLRYEERVARSTEVNDALVLVRKSNFNYYKAFFEYNVALAKLERATGSSIHMDLSIKDKK